MGKTLIVEESAIKEILVRERLNETSMNKSDVSDIVRDTIKNDQQVKKEIEKRIKEQIANSINTLFKTLWQRRNFYEDEIKRG